MALGATGFAADVAPRLRLAPVPYLAPWAGVYVGLFAGGHWSRDRWTSDTTAPADFLGPFNLNANGFSGGLVSGANLQRGNFVWGVETDIGFFTGSNNFGPLPTLFPGNADIDSIETKLRYNAHARLRFGYSMGSWLPFIAAGAAYANTRATLTDTTNPTAASPDVTRSITQNRIGYTIGGGVDVAFAPNWIARVEYLHDRYLTSAFGLSVEPDSEYLELNSNTVRAALVYKYDEGNTVLGGIFKAPPPSRAQTWAGVYIGAFAGGHSSTDRWSSDSTNPANFAGPFDLKASGFTGGGLIGANVQYGNHVWGVEADAGFLTGAKTFGELRTQFPNLANIDSIETQMRWNAHARIRKGYSFGQWMPFVATGVAYANTRMALVTTTRSGSIGLDRIGFSSGGGVDWMFAPNWIARVEYIHDRYASASYEMSVRLDTQHLELSSHIVRGALMYKFDDGLAAPASGGIYKAPVAPVFAGWTGGYVGLFAGGHWSTDRWSSDSVTPNAPGSTLGSFLLKVDGGNFGGLIGANLQQGKAVWGIEGDGGWMTGTANQTLVAGDIDFIESKMRANAHGRLRFGYDAGNWMPFVAGGVAYANTRVEIGDSTNTPPQPTSSSIDLNRVGFTFGGGVDWRFTANWIARVEYLHDRYGTASFSLPVETDSQHMELRSNIVRGALIYKLDGGPVVARY